MNFQTLCSTCRKHLRIQGVWCDKCVWVHLKCRGLKSKNDHTATFICQPCSQRPTTADEITPTQTEAPNNANPLPQSSNDLTSPAELQASDFWANLTDETIDQTLTDLYNEAAHWKPGFFTVSKNKTWLKFVEILPVIFDQGAIGGPNAKVALTAAMLMPHLILARTKTDTDTSNNKTITRRLNSWVQGDMKSLFSEAKALQTRLPKGREMSDIYTVEGSRVLGSVIGSAKSCSDFKDKKTENFIKLVEKLLGLTKIFPHNVYHAYTRGVQTKLSFLSRTTPDFQPALEKTEGIVSSSLITAITGRKVTDQQRKLFSLPLKHGGLNIIMPKDREIDLCQSPELSKCLDGNDPVEADRIQSEALTRHR